MGPAAAGCGTFTRHHETWIVIISNEGAL